MKIIIGNWKMNGSQDFTIKFIEEINKLETMNKIIICPPAPLIPFFEKFKHKIGAQNCFYEKFGAFTGENSPYLLKELGCEYVLIGHSERRSIFDESDEIIYKKWDTAISNNLIPVVCLGEKLEERNYWKEVISAQLKPYYKENLETTIFAYEPVWSIGTGIIPTENEIHNACKFIKSIVKDSNVLYGGSVNSKNYRQILNCKNVDGLLIGGASLKIKEFSEIIKYV